MSIANDIARHQAKLDAEAAEESQLEAAQAEIKRQILKGLYVEIWTGTFENVMHGDAMADWGSPDLDAWLCIAHDRWSRDTKIMESERKTLRGHLDESLDRAAKHWAPAYIEAKKRRAQEWNDSLSEPVDAEFFSRMAG